MSRLFTSGGQSIGASASALVLPMNIQISSNAFHFSVFLLLFYSKKQHSNLTYSVRTLLLFCAFCFLCSLLFVKVLK